MMGEVISRLEKKGLKIVGLKMVHPTRELAAAHYAEHKDKPFFDDLVDYLISGPVIAMVLQADNCVTIARKLVGKTKPEEADLRQAHLPSPPCLWEPEGRDCR